MKNLKDWFMKLPMAWASAIIFALCWGPAALLGQVEGTPGVNDTNWDHVIAGLWIAPFAIIGLFALINTFKR